MSATTTESNSEQMIYVVEQFHGDGFREVAAAITHERAEEARQSVLYKCPDLLCRIVQKPSWTSEVWLRGTHQPLKGGRA